jgi:sulfite exporter TauE/SafE
VIGLAVPYGAWTTATLWGVFVAGLAGGFGHCAGMCGPLVASASALAGAAGRERAGARGAATAGSRAAALAWWQAAYHAGRLGVYAALGAVLGALGSLPALSRALGPLQRWVWLAAGVLMVTMGLAAAGVPMLSRLSRSAEKGFGALTAGWTGRATRALADRGAWAALPLGMLNGLVPCGLMIPVELAALAAGSSGLGAVTMIAFGLGTLPALVAVGAAAGLLGARGRAWMVAVGGIAVAALGAAYLVRAVGALVTASG